MTGKDLLARYPEANITAVDIADNMLQVCRERYADYDNCQYLCTDIILTGKFSIFAFFFIE